MEIFFSQIKEKVNFSSLTLIPKPKKTYQLETDALDLAIREVLRILTPQGYKPVAYKFIMLSFLERNYPIHDKKLFEIVHALKKWCCYLKGI